jgi:hypothetical protein
MELKCNFCNVTLDITKPFYRCNCLVKVGWKDYSKCTYEKVKKQIEFQYLFDNTDLLVFYKYPKEQFVEFLIFNGNSYDVVNTVDYKFPKEIDHIKLSKLKDLMSILS